MNRGIWRTLFLVVGITGWISQLAYADDAAAQQKMQGSMMDGEMKMDMSAMDMHAHHHVVLNNDVTSRTVAYVVPPVKLVRADGKEVSLPAELNDGKPVVLNFIYTTCTTICPLTSQTFSSFQEKLGNQRDSIHLVSISIDPEQDTPERISEYAKKFHAGSEWQFYTGTLTASVATQRAFDAYRGNKMDHVPVTFIRAAPGKDWLRIDGFVTPDDLLDRYNNLLKSGS